MDQLKKALKDRDLAEIRKAIQAARAPILEDFRTGGITGATLTKQLSRITDEQVTIFADHFLGQYKNRIAMVFTGGNGRGEVHPYSDLDLLTLVPEELPAGFAEAYSNFYQAIHDAGFTKPGLIVRSPADCTEQAQKDQTIWTSMLDRRFSWGDKALFERMDLAMDNLRDEKGEMLLAEKIEERGIRLGKMADSRYMLYPDIKEGRGGLRDYQTVLWIAQSLFGCDDMACFLDKSLLSAEEMRRIEKAHDFLMTVRSHLHAMQERPQDRINAEILPSLIARYNESRPDSKPENIESFMRLYFGHTREIGFFANIVSAAVEDRTRWNAPTRTVAEHFEITDSHIRFKGRIEDPIDMIRIFKMADSHGRKIDHSALRAIRAHNDMIDDAVRVSPEANALFIDILTSGENAAGLLRQMQETGLLQKFIPGFAHIDMLMQFDPYHEYTVDEHIFHCLEEMAGLEKGDQRHAPLATKIFAATDENDRQALYVATLLHDICKRRSGDHEKNGAEYVRKIGPRLGLSEEQTQLASWLVSEHLLMSYNALHYDPYDPATIENFCKNIPSEKHLNMLVLLTTADIMGVGPGRWNWNKAASIHQLYDNARLYLAEQELKVAPQTTLPADYVPGETRIEIENDKVRDVTVVTVITPDRDALFEKLTGALSLLGGNILDASIETTHGEPATAIDRFTIKTSFGEAYEEYDFDRIRKKSTPSWHRKAT